MARTRCAFCDHENPPGSRFCNQCGSMLHLVPCTQCEAINDEAYATCHRCGAELTAQQPIAQAAAQANANAERAYAIEALGRSLAPSAPQPSQAAKRTPVEPTLTAPPPVASPVAANGAPRDGFVVPPDDERLAAARSVAADARRRRLYRSAVIAALVVAAAPVVYYEFFPRDPLAGWLRTVQVDVVNAIRQRAGATTPSTEAPRAPQTATSAPPAESPTATPAPPPADVSAIPQPGAAVPASSGPMSPESAGAAGAADANVKVPESAPPAAASATEPGAPQEKAIESPHAAQTPSPRVKAPSRRSTRRTEH